MADERTTWELHFEETGTETIEARLAKLHASIKQVELDEQSLADHRRNNAPLIGKQVEALEGLEVGLGNVSRGTRDYSAMLGQFSVVGVAALGAVAVAAGAAAVALNELDSAAVKAFGERTSTLRAYTTILGDAKRAELEYARANELASKTELSSASTLKAQQSLITAGFRGDDLTKALAASMDVASTRQPEERDQVMSQLGRAFSQVIGAGKLRGEELAQLSEAGVNRGKVLEILGQGDTGRGEKMVSGGQVTAQKGLEAIYQAITSSLGTQQLGEFATGASGSLAGLLSNRAEALDILLKSFDGETLPAVKRYKQALTDQTNALSTSSETGKGLVMMLSDFTSITTNVKAIWTDFSTAFLESFVQSFTAERAADGAFVATTENIKELGAWLGKVGSTVGVVARGFEAVMGALEPIAAFLARFGKAVAAAGDLSDGKSFFGFADRFNKAWEGDESDLSDAERYRKRNKSMTAAQRAVAEGSWADFKKRQAGGETEGFTAEERAADEALWADVKRGRDGRSSTVTKWGSSKGGGGTGGAGGAVSGFRLGLTGGHTEGPGSLQERLDQAMGAAARQSSAPSAAGPMGAYSEGSSGAASGAVIQVDRVEIVVNGAVNAEETGREVFRQLSQLGRLVRAPGRTRS